MLLKVDKVISRAFTKILLKILKITIIAFLYILYIVLIAAAIIITLLLRLNYIII